MIAPWKGAPALRAAVAANADRHAENLRPVVEDLRAQGVVTLRGIADELNLRGMRTGRDGVCQVTNVGNLVRRLTTS